MSHRTVILASPRGFCAGVRRAVEIAESVLSQRPHPVYGLREIVHNRQVVNDLREKGIVFVQDIAEVPEGATVLFSAHGVPPSVREAAAARRLDVVDATCPFVMKVHVEVQRFVREDRTIALIGHRRHDEVVGVAGEAPERVVVIENEEESAAFMPADPERVAVITQTTLSQAETDRVLNVLKSRFPHLRTPSKKDICYATTNRQEAVKQLAKRVDLILVLGSENSSNSRRLAEVAVTNGAEAHLLSSPETVDAIPLDNRSAIGLTAGASTPEAFIAEILSRLREKGFDRVEEMDVVHEDIHFALPPALRTTPNA
ncbi:MAG: 4-hydroxy-3-methylbut-2-enyl diphosphate reductase [Kiritimatiellia bacterium]